MPNRPQSPAPPVYRPSRGSLQLTPSKWKFAPAVTLVGTLKSGWTLKSRWPAIQEAVTAYGNLLDGDLPGRRQGLLAIRSAIGKWKSNQEKNKWDSDLDLSKKNAVQNLELLIQQEWLELSQPSISSPPPPLFTLPMGGGFNSSSSSSTQIISNRNDSPPLSRPIPIGFPSSTSKRYSPPPMKRRDSTDIFELDFEDDDERGSSRNKSPVSRSPLIKRSSVEFGNNSNRNSSSPSSSGSSPKFVFESLDNELLKKLNLRTYLHFTQKPYLKSIGEKGLIAGFKKGIGLPLTGEQDTTNVYVLSGSPGAGFASGEGGGYPVAVITSLTPGRDPNYKGGAYMFSKEIPPMHSFTSDGTTFCFNLPPDGPTLLALAQFVNRYRTGLPLSPGEVWKLVRADLKLRFPLHMRGL